MTTATSPPSTARQMLNKVPEVTIFFWIIKILATTVGETAADYVAGDLGLGLLVAMGVVGAGLVVVLALQFRARGYVAGLYWPAVVLISIVGTLITDFLVDERGVSLWTTTIGFGFALAATFTVWFASEKTL